MEPLFDHEKLTVYQRSISFVAWTATILEKAPKTSSLHNQLDRASTSIPLNIAEGNGKWSTKDRCRFFDIARGSTLECAAALDVGVAKNFFTEQEVEPGKTELVNIVRMLIGLIKANNPDRSFGDNNRVQETVAFYGSDVNTGEQEQD
tara:strand:+ start:2269 stop:2712 length:444 start_codon:yes stop_codon:yes gene_type:complete